ncbi:unnamed protein product [Thlaspi arvense]|uniref:Phorbol-ester/DAG-type domain-containing protein n=1 Tax=Thlaspi arvense TaxID=13288 RepID=A0AAU9SIS1_THLAR|nr:unnamed protein product [Thlaspi arvense]
MDTQSYNLPIHEHPLFSLDKFAQTFECHGCQLRKTINDAYVCNEAGCGVWFHSKCVTALLADSAAYSLPIHEHPLYSVAKFVEGHECRGCHVRETLYGGYMCRAYGCVAFFHKVCAEGARSEINHPSHPQHPLLLTNDLGDGPCAWCGTKLLGPCYSCSTCEFKVDLACVKKPPPSAIEHPVWHDHPIILLKKKEGDKEKKEEKSPCEVCKESICGPSFSCLECNAFFHVECVDLLKELNHPNHPNHPLKLITFDTLTDGAEKTCLFCGEETKSALYHCSVCNFTTCIACTRNPPPLVINHTKTHKHQLTLFPRKMPMTCDVCGEEGKGAPYYVCLRCAFVIHGWCIEFPLFININRHDHCISFTHNLGVGYSKCGVCRKSLSQYHGAYTCSICPSYAVHPRCAQRDDVWDQLEFIKFPDDIQVIAPPFKVVGDGLIIHQSHSQHNLRLQKDDTIHDKWLRCEACIHPVSFDPIYYCEECGFVLHEKCANLPTIKKLFFQTDPFTLDFDSRNIIDCAMCGTLSTGFTYLGKYVQGIDIHCGTLPEPLVHDGHVHPLYLNDDDGRYCDGCHSTPVGYVFRCDDCSFHLCYYCASLPKKIWHTNDEHPLTLHCGEEARYNNWCDNCEREIDPCGSTCDLCGKELPIPCYSCSTCEFKVDLTCGMKPFPAIEHSVYHDHPLVFLKQPIPYVEVVKYCEVYEFNIGEPSYSCHECNVYFHHLRTMPRRFVFRVDKNHNQKRDSVELEGIPDDTEDIAPYKVVGDDLISHFTHDKHPLELYKKNILYDERILCEACIDPLGFDSIYGFCPYRFGIGTMNTLSLYVARKRATTIGATINGSFTMSMAMYRTFEVVRNNHSTRPLCSVCLSRCMVAVILKYCDQDKGYTCSFHCFTTSFRQRIFLRDNIPFSAL